MSRVQPAVPCLRGRFVKGVINCPMFKGTVAIKLVCVCVCVPDWRRSREELTWLYKNSKNDRKSKKKRNVEDKRKTWSYSKCDWPITNDDGLRCEIIVSTQTVVSCVLVLLCTESPRTDSVAVVHPDLFIDSDAI